MDDAAPDMDDPALAVLRVHLGAHASVLEAEPGPYLRLDAEGRWTALRNAHGTYRRTLGGGVVRRQRAGFARLPEAQARRLDTQAYGTLEAMGRLLDPGAAVTIELRGDRDALAARIAAGRRWTPARMAAHALALRAVWPEPTRILPPHRYRDLVVLPAVGCPNHECTFCAFYRDRPFRVLDDETFEGHLVAIVETLGAARAERTGLFLGSASALSLRDELLLRRMARAQVVLGEPRRGIAAFLDPDRAPRRTPADWARLGTAGLTDVTIGLETGLPDLRAAAGKRDDVEALVAGVRDMRAGGLRLGVTVLLGLGGVAREEAHRRATLDALAAMALEPEDKVYLSPLVDGEATPASDLAAWRAACARVTPARALPYLIERFAWLA